MIDRSNLYEANEFFRDRQRKANALRRAVRKENKERGIITGIRKCIYDILPGIAIPPMRAEIATDYHSRRGGFDGGFLAGVLR
jgi:hypothetical protein